MNELIIYVLLMIIVAVFDYKIVRRQERLALWVSKHKPSTRLKKKFPLMVVIEDDSEHGIHNLIHIYDPCYVFMDRGLYIQTFKDIFPRVAYYYVISGDNVKHIS